MRIVATLGLALVTALGPVFAESQTTPSFVGEWMATAHTPGAEASEIVRVVKTRDGYAITARLVGPAAESGMPQAGPGEEIVLDADHFSYERTLTTSGPSLVIKYSGVVSGDTFTGAVDLGGFGTVPYTGVRIKQ